MDTQALTETAATADASPRDASRPRHFHFRRRRVLWALGFATETLPDRSLAS